jgi:hypothetical protein
MVVIGFAAAANAALPPVVEWTAAQVRSAGLRTAHLVPAVYRQEFSASATVHSVATLAHDLDALAAARAGSAVAQSRLQLATLQAQRAQGLYAAGRNIALWRVQQAQADVAQAAAELRGALAARALAAAQLTADAGAALSDRLRQDAALRRSLLQGDTLLVTLDLPAGSTLPASAEVRLLLPNGASPVPAQVIGPAACASNQLQGARDVLIAPASSGLMPGLRVTAAVRSARPQSGVWLPSSAVVWSGAQAVVFVAMPQANGVTRFTPREVSTAWPWHGGYVQPGWSAVDLVTRGTVLLLTPPPAPHAVQARDGDDD